MNDIGAGNPDSAPIRRARALARVLDSAIGVPGTPLRLGLDPILGLFPGAGDLAAAVLSGYIVLAGARAGAPRAVLGRMVLNILVDTALGSIPILGDVFDVAFKSNMRNVELLERYAAEPARVSAASRRLGAIAVFVLLLALIAVGAGMAVLARLVWHALTR